MKYILLVLLFIGAYSCNTSQDKNTQKKTTVAVENTSASDEEDLSLHPGYNVYQQHCLPCHQADGNGVPGMYPGLHNTRWVNGDKKELISIIINGLEGEIEVNGEYFNTVMAPLPHLTDQEVADVLTYVRKQYGTNASEITVEEVKSFRNSL